MPDQSDMNMDGCGCLWRKPGMEKDSKKLAGVSDVVERMRERKRAYGFSYGEIATRAGIPLGTVQKVLIRIKFSAKVNKFYIFSK